MRTRYGQSPWIAEFPSKRRPSYPRLRGTHTVPVAIVGGGLTGCATAYACAVAGVKAILVESGRMGYGAAGHSAGLLLPDPGPAFRDVAQAYGLRAARHAFEAWRRAALDGAALLRRLGLGKRLDAFDCLIVAPPGEDRALGREYRARKDAGLPVSWLSGKQVRQTAALDAGGGIRLHDGFGLDPYRACLALGAAAAQRGAALFEQSPVTKIRARRKDVEIVVEGATLTAEHVIVTTGSATGTFRPLQRHFKRRETYLVLTEPMPAAMRRDAGHPGLTLRDTREPRHRIRWTRDNRILVAGADQAETPARRRDAVLIQRTGQLMYELLTMYPAISGLQPAYGWHLPYGETADGLPYVGPHRNYPRHLFALGAGGDSVTGAFLAARVLLRALRGEPEKADAVFGFTR